MTRDMTALTADYNATRTTGRSTRNRPSTPTLEPEHPNRTRRELSKNPDPGQDASEHGHISLLQSLQGGLKIDEPSLGSARTISREGLKASPDGSLDIGGNTWG